MKSLNLSEVVQYVEENINSFHMKRLQSLQSLKLQKILKRKNPYLFKAKNILTAERLVKTLLDAHLSSQEETIFGEFLEGLAIFICGKTYKGRKSPAVGVDLEFEKGGITYIITIKSGPNWGNAGQIKNMKEDFSKAKRILRTNNPKANVRAVNGCCYGQENQPDKGEYLKYCGQKFWEFISGDKRLYLDIIEPLGHRAKEKNDTFLESYAQIVNKFTFEFMKLFCVDGKIDWNKLVKFNSAQTS